MRSKVKKMGSLEIEAEAIKINPTFMRIQKICIFLMCVILFFALIGLFGGGIFGNAKKVTADAEIDYARFSRVQATHALRFYFFSTQDINKNTSIWINNAFVKKNIVRNIIPSPIFEESFNNGIRYHFNTHLSNNKIITFILEPENAGFLTTEISIDNKEKIQLNQFIYP